MGWKTFSSGLIAGFDKAIDVGTPIIKNFDKLVELNKIGKLNDRLATTNGSISYCDRSMSGFGLATYSENSYTYASTIAINATYEVEVENMTSEQFDRLMNAESKANDQTNQILNSIQTLEGLDIYSNECGYATEINPYKVIDCYYKNQDRIEKAGK